jgi:hypothetical protein
MPLEPLRSKVVGAGAPNSDATWLPAPSAPAADLLSTKNFYFADRSTPLDLEAIRDIDLERIERDVDIEALQRHLEPLVFGRLPEVLDAGEGHAAFRKLFRLSQLTLEYLLNVQDVLAEGLDKASQACSESSRNAERYRKRAKKLDARVKMLERDLASKRDAAHAYQGLVMSASSRPPAPVVQPMSVTTEPSVNFPLGDATVYVTMPDGTATQHAIQEGTTAADLRNRAGYTGRTYFRGRRLAADVTLGDAGVRDGDCIMVVQDGLDQGQQSEPLDDRIADLERSIRGELAMQVQTQLAALRGSLPSQNPQPSGCLAGDLEDDDEAVDDETNMQTVLTSPFDASQSGFFGQSPHAGDLRAMETRLSAQMDALEAKMSELMGDAVHRVTLPRAATPQPAAVKSVSRKTTPRPAPATPKATTPHAGAVEDDLDEEPRDASFEFSCVFGEGAWPVKPKGKLSLVVAPEETISTVRCAVASKLDLEVDRIRLRDKSTGEDIGTAADLEAADVVCQIVTGDLISDGQVEDLARLKSILGDNALDASTAAQREALDQSIEARRAVWRAVPPAHGAAAATREDVVHLEVRLNALQKLVASIDSTTTWDAEMVAKVDEALSAFGGGLDPAVNAAVARIRARVDERAALVAERVAE